MALTPLSLALWRVTRAVSSTERATPFAGSLVYRRAFALGVTAGGVYFAGALYWIPGVLAQFGDLPLVVGVLLTGLLVAFLALYPACWAMIVAFLLSRLGPIAWSIAPAVWVATELGRGYVFGGFPWVLLGYSQVTVLPVAQVASLTGVYGLSALLVAASTASTAALTATTRRARLISLAPVLGCVLIVVVWGGGRLRESALTRQGHVLKVGLVQGNIPQTEKWNPGLSGSIFQTYLAMSREAAARGAQLLIWPESATPFNYEDDPPGHRAIQDLSRSTGAPILFGSEQEERTAGGIRYYNAAFLVDPSGRAVVYRKIHLVPFGEYVPLRALLFFAKPLVQTVSDFSPGLEPVMMPIGDHRIATAICYEVIYPHLVTASVRMGAELLTTITNDAWYGPTSAPLQHFEQAAMRAIEQGRYLVRSANTGVSGIVDPYGRVLARSRLFERETIVGDVRLLREVTVYGRIGDAFAYACIALTLAAVGAAVRSVQ